MSELTVGVLGLHNSKETKAILNAADALGLGTEWLRTENLTIEIQDGVARLEPDVDVIVNRLLLSKAEQPAEGLGLAATLDRLRPMVNQPSAQLTALHKFATATALVEGGLPVPDALLALATDRLNASREGFGPEAVYKTAIGTHGGGTWKVDLDDPVNPRVGDRLAFLQAFVGRDPDEQRDLRVYVVGGEVIGAMTRFAPEGDWRTNVALGGAVEDASESLPEEARDIAVRATDVVGLEFAGVDMVEDADGWYVLEVNPTAGFRGLFRATGRSPAPYIVQRAVELVGGQLSDEEVAELAETLDDSVPACRPPPTRVDPAEPVTIGLVEEAVVSGTSGQQTVLAKADTGATRTSVDATLAAEIGTGPITDIVRVKSGSVPGGKTRPVVDLVVGLGGTRHTVAASVEDRSHMDYPLLLGRDILQHYHVDVGRRVDATDSETEE